MVGLQAAFTLLWVQGFQVPLTVVLTEAPRQWPGPGFALALLEEWRQ